MRDTALLARLLLQDLCDRCWTPNPSKSSGPATSRRGTGRRTTDLRGFQWEQSDFALGAFNASECVGSDVGRNLDTIGREKRGAPK